METPSAPVELNKFIKKLNVAIEEVEKGELKSHRLQQEINRLKYRNDKKVQKSQFYNKLTIGRAIAAILGTDHLMTKVELAIILHTIHQHPEVITNALNNFNVKDWKDYEGDLPTLKDIDEAREEIGTCDEESQPFAKLVDDNESQQLHALLIRLPEGLYETITTRAKLYKMSRSEYIHRKLVIAETR